MTDEEVAIKIYFTGVVWILSCDTRILLQRNKVLKRRETHKRATSSSTACAVPLPRWGRLKRPTNQNLKIQIGDIDEKKNAIHNTFLSDLMFYMGQFYAEPRGVGRD